VSLLTVANTNGVWHSLLTGNWRAAIVERRNRIACGV
jgi:hypothetical protein